MLYLEPCRGLSRMKAMRTWVRVRVRVRVRNEPDEHDAHLGVINSGRCAGLCGELGADSEAWGEPRQLMGGDN